MTKRHSPIKVIGWTLQLLLALAVIAIGILLVTGNDNKEVESSPNDRLESPYGIPDYNSDPKYDRIEQEEYDEFIDGTSESVINYHPAYDTHYAQNAKAICTSLDKGGVKFDDVFESRTDGSGKTAYISVESYCPHNL